MIHIFRNQKFQKQIYIVLTVVIVFAFVIWGTVNIGSDKAAPTFIGKIEGHSISLQEYLRSYNAAMHDLVMRYGDDARMIMRFVNLKAEAFDRILLLHHAKKNNIKVSDQEVVDWISKQEVFWRDGKFDDKIYKQFTANFMNNQSRDTSISARDFEEEIRQMLTLEKLRNHLSQSLVLTDQEIREIYNKENSPKDLVYGILGKDAFIPEVTVTEEEIEKVYPILQEDFKVEGKEFNLDEARSQIKQLLIQQKSAELANQKLSEILASVTEQNSLESIAKEKGIELKTVQNFTSETLVEDLGNSKKIVDILSNLGEGETSKVLSLPKGATFIKVTKIHPTSDQEFEKNKESFRKIAFDKKEREAFEKLLIDLRNKLNLNLDAVKKLNLDNSEAVPS